MPQGHQAALPCCVTASTFPHCTEGFFWVILSCHLPERPGRSHLEWCSGHEKVVTVSPRACQFLEGSQLCSLTVKGTAVEACSVTQAHLLVVLPSILCLAVPDSMCVPKLRRLGWRLACTLVTARAESRWNCNVQIVCTCAPSSLMLSCISGIQVLGPLVGSHATDQEQPTCAILYFCEFGLWKGPHSSILWAQ